MKKILQLILNKFLYKKYNIKEKIIINDFHLSDTNASGDVNIVVNLTIPVKLVEELMNGI